jgi:hypothetical protein
MGTNTQSHAADDGNSVRRSNTGHLIFDHPAFSTVECLGEDQSYNTEPFPDFCPGCGAAIADE